MRNSRLRIEYESGDNLTIKQEKWDYNHESCDADYEEMERMFSLFDDILKEKLGNVMPDDIYKNWIAHSVMTIFCLESKDLKIIEEEQNKRREEYQAKKKLEQTE